MPYTGSKSFIPPAGTSFNINTGSLGSPLWTPLSEVGKITPSGRKKGVEDTTNLSSLGKEKLDTILDSGSVEVEFNYLGGDEATDLALETAFVAGGVHQFTIIVPGLPSGKAETTAFSAIIIEKDITAIERDKVMKAKVKLDVTGVYTFTQA